MYEWLHLDSRICGNEQANISDTLYLTMGQGKVGRNVINVVFNYYM